MLTIFITWCINSIPKRVQDIRDLDPGDRNTVLFTLAFLVAILFFFGVLVYLAGTRWKAQKDFARSMEGGQYMTLGGWVMMTVSVGFVLTLLTFCFYRVVRTPTSTEHMQAPLEIDTHDADT